MTSKNENEPVLTITDLMKRWKCARKTILDAVKRRELAVFKVGERVYRVTLEEVLRYERENPKSKAA